MGLESFEDVDKLKKKEEDLKKKSYYGLDGRLEMSDTEWLMKNELNERRSLFQDKSSSDYDRMSQKDYIDLYGDDRIYPDGSQKEGYLKRVIATDETDLMMLKTTGNAFKRIAEEHRKRFAEEMEKEKGRSK